MRTPERIAIPPEVMAREVGGETVILDLASGSYFGLNAVGTRIWQLVAAGLDTGQIVDTLLREYDAQRTAVEQDLDKLLDELVQRGLIRIEAP
jgi:hypothetical protein